MEAAASERVVESLPSLPSVRAQLVETPVESASP
jgi:hypothetical protein